MKRNTLDLTFANYANEKANKIILYEQEYAYEVNKKQKIKALKDSLECGLAVFSLFGAIWAMFVLSAIM